MTSARSGDAEDLGGGGHSGAALGDAILEHRGHSGSLGCARDGPRISAGTDQTPYLFGCFEELEHSGAATIPRTAATFAPAGLMHDLTGSQPKHCVARVGRERHGCQSLSSFATLAEDTNQPLRDDGTQRRLQQEIFNAQVEEARYCSRRSEERRV